MLDSETPVAHSSRDTVAALVPSGSEPGSALQQFLARKLAVQQTVASICLSKFHLAAGQGAFAGQSFAFTALCTTLSLESVLSSAAHPPWDPLPRAWALTLGQPRIRSHTPRDPQWGLGGCAVRNVNLRSMARSGLGWVVHGRQAMRQGPPRSQGKLQ